MIKELNNCELLQNIVIYALFSSTNLLLLSKSQKWEGSRTKVLSL